MPRKPSNAKQAKAAAPAGGKPDNQEIDETTSETGEGTEQGKAAAKPSTQSEQSKTAASSDSGGQTVHSAESKAKAKTKSGMIDATLRSRHCMGGICKEAGETMRMTYGEYDRLKKYGRVE